MQGKVELCGVNTSKLPLLKNAEMRELIAAAQSGDMAARDKLINGNLRLVLSVIQKFSGRGESMDDLFQVGCIGLIKAIDCFDLSQNVQFSTYGVPMISGELRRFLRDHGAVRVSRSVRDTAYRVLQVKERLTAELGREPDVEVIAKDLGIKRSEVVFALDSICDPVSLYEPVYSDSGESVCVMDQIGDTKNTDEHWLEQIALDEAVARLSDRERRILSLRFYLGRTARDKLINGNLRLVLSVIQKFSGRGESMDDLFQVGCIGLIKAIDCFDLSQNVQFSTYGVPMISGELRRFLRDHGAVRVSRSVRDTAYRVLQVKERLTAELGREPDVEVIAKDLGIKRSEVVFALDSICDPVSLYEPVYSDSGESVCVMDQIGDTKNTDEHWLEQIALDEAVARLSDRERRILSLRFYLGRTQTEVAREIGISQAQVSRLEKNAIGRIKKELGS